MKYALFHGAKKNVGDFLIRDRAKQLVIEYAEVTEDDLVEFEMVRRPITKELLSQLGDAEAVILAGGPAYQERFYPEVYPSLEAVLDSGLPIYPLGPGWYGTNEEDYEFTNASIEMLRRIHDRIEWSGVRDPPTKRVLKDHGINNVEFVGCPAWYDLHGSVGGYNRPASVESIVISTVVPESEYLRKQFHYLLRRVAEEYPNMDKYCSFHRGIYHDDYTPFVRSLHLRKFRRSAERLGYQVLNTAYDTENLEIYREIDVHVGYRVHGHIFFLAQNHPSYLLQVDGRGKGASEGLKTPGDIRAYDRPSYEKPVEEVLENLQRDLLTGFRAFDPVQKQIETKYADIQRLINTFP